MEIKSYAFQHDGRIPDKYTCDGENISPPLEISDVPENTQSLVLIMEDPDVPKEVRPEQIWDHWVVFNIPPETSSIPENTNPGTKGKGDYPKLDYGGPCPPPQYEPKEHRYFFKLYALDIKLSIPEGSTKEKLERTIEGHVLTKTELIGLYSRK